MKASEFIKVALIDQMQQIADLGLWFHVSRMLPAGVELLARVNYLGEDDGMAFGPFRMEDWVKKFYAEVFPGKYSAYPDSASFFSKYPKIWLTSKSEEQEAHLTTTETGKTFVHVPAWFEDFKSACRIVLYKIEAGELEDIEVLKTLEND